MGGYTVDMARNAAANQEFVAFVLDQLSDLEGVSAKRMFGGFGVYSQGLIFAIVSDARLYFKTDDQTKQRYIAAEMQPFQPTQKMTLKTYYEVPPDVIESRLQLVEWARESLACERED